MSREAPGKLVVVGQGYVGLPLALRAVEVGYDVIGFDHYGASAPGALVLEKFGITAEHMVERARALLGATAD